MDRVEKTSIIIKQLNRFRNNEIKDYEFIKSVCNYFDNIKELKLNEFDLEFLKFLSDKSGIPMYFDMLEKFDHKTNIDNIDLQTFSSILYESTLYTDEKTFVHKYQKEVLDKFIFNHRNRFLLTASTSFGKTFLVYEIIKKMKYENVLLIFPSIALLSENLEKILRNNSYFYLKEKYKIFTLSEIDELSTNNIFIYTPERYLSFIEKNTINFDFIFIDEIYKIDNEFELDEEIKENERDTAYRLTSMFAAKNNCDLLLAGPYINVKSKSFMSYLTENHIAHIDFNNYEIVNKLLFNKNNYLFCNETENSLNMSVYKNKKDLFIQTVNNLLQKRENVIVYSANRGKNYGVEFYAELLSENISYKIEQKELANFLEHIKNTFSEDWIVYKALRKGIGIHHGLVPKYIQKEIINLFNKGIINILISTTTITEGVNTSAKNLIVLQNKKGNKQLKSFDAKNIAGRAGRLGYHYSGNIFDLSKDFSKILKEKETPLQHKNYEIDIKKDDIDILYTEDKFLSPKDKSEREDIFLKQKERNIPTEILKRYKMISWKNKLLVYDRIKKLSSEERKLLDNVIEDNYKNYKYFDIAGMQIIFNILEPIITNNTLWGSVKKKDKNNKYSIVCYSIITYLKNGIRGLINYYCKKKTFDEAISISAKFVFNTLKYQIVKYFGVFNIMYKYIVTQEKKVQLEDVHCIDRMLRYFEYNSVSNIGRKISDYGVPSKILAYYEEKEMKNGNEKHINFDNYEKEVFARTRELFEQE